MQIVFIGLLIATFAGLMLWDAKSASKALERRSRERQEQETTADDDIHNG